MAKKSFLVKQRIKYNGDISQNTFTYECEETEIQAIVGKLAGVVTVFEENVTLSSAEGASDVVTTGLPIDYISMSHSEAKSVYFSGFKPIVFKDTVKVTDLQEMFKLHKPFKGAYESQKPDNALPKLATTMTA